MVLIRGKAVTESGSEDDCVDVRALLRLSQIAHFLASTCGAYLLRPQSGLVFKKL
jgi:hypothetical protein